MGVLPHLSRAQIAFFGFMLILNIWLENCQSFGVIVGFYSVISNMLTPWGKRLYKKYLSVVKNTFSFASLWQHKANLSPSVHYKAAGAYWQSGSLWVNLLSLPYFSTFLITKAVCMERGFVQELFPTWNHNPPCDIVITSSATTCNIINTCWWLQLEMREKELWRD